MADIRGQIRKGLKGAFRSIGYDVVKYSPDGNHRPATAPPVSLDPNLVVVPRYLCPNGHKLFDFRTETGFAEIAREILSHGRTTLDHARLLVLWHAVKNIRTFDRAVAEVGTYRGGSARFIATSLAHWGVAPPIHVFDTFAGHPEVVVPEMDYPHTIGFFSDTSLLEVQAYLAPFPNIEFHVGAFHETCAQVAGQTFSLVYIDVDIYQSTVDCLEFFWPRLCGDGLVVVDDYGMTTCQGLKRAVDEFVDRTPDCQGWYVHNGPFVMTKRGSYGS